VPFTVSHVAAVMPLYRPLSKAHVFTAAVIGSMVPDFGMLLPRIPARWETHSLLGLFIFCLPVGLLTYWLTQILIKPAVLETLPDHAYARLRSAEPAPSLSKPRTWLPVIGALLFGALTHLVWDNFTHENAHVVRAIPMLGFDGPDFIGHPMRLYRWLQLVSSIVGLIIVLAGLALWLRHTPRPIEPLPRRLPVQERVLWSVLYFVPPLLMAAYVVWRVWSWHLPLTREWVLAGIAVNWVRGSALSLLLTSALIRLRLA
jgi:hypothetical protein